MDNTAMHDRIFTPPFMHTALMMTLGLLYRTVARSLFSSFHEKTVRIAPDELSFTNASAWHNLYGHRGCEDSPNRVEGIFTAKNTEHSHFFAV